MRATGLGTLRTDNRIRVGRAGVSAVLAAALLLGAAALAPAEPAVEHVYSVRLDSGLATLEVKAEIPGARVVRPSDPRAVDSLRTRRACDDSPLRIVRGALQLMPQQPECVVYTVDAKGIDGRSRWEQVDLGPDVLWTTAGRWLWRAESDHVARTLVTIETPAGVDVSVPWTRLDDRGGGARRYVIPASPRSARAVTVFGRFQRISLTGPGPDAVLLAGSQPVRTALVERWLDDAVAQLRSPYGRFPNPAAQVVVVPLDVGGRAGSPVPWAHVIRDGGEAVQFFIDPQQPLSRFLDDWTATHEFAHLMLPHVERGQKWISEGFASYYQVVLMARAGRYSPTEAWSRLHRGFEAARAEGGARTPDEAARAGVGRARMMIYWSGAALALMLDVDLRRGSAGEVSLDALLGRLRACCLPASRTWSGRELFARLDSLGGTSRTSELYRVVAGQTGMPDMTPYYRRLGLEFEDGRARFAGDAPDAAVRRAIMGEDDPGPQLDPASELHGIGEPGVGVEMLLQVDHEF